MKNFIKAFMILSFSLTIAACSISEAATQSRYIALEWAEAELQWDGEQRMKLLTDEAKEKYKDSQHVKGEAIDPDLNIGENYGMKEWKINDDSYLYQIRYYNEHQRTDTVWTRTQKTDEGWRITDIMLYPNEISAWKQGKEPIIVKELK